MPTTIDNERKTAKHDQILSGGALHGSITGSMLSAVAESRSEIQAARSRLPVLEYWLAPTPIDAFTREYLGRQPYASPSTAAGAVSIFDWLR